MLFKSARPAGNSVLVDCLRAVAALLVLFAHSDAHSLARIDALVPYRGALGQVGVYLFFVLSGFLIWTSASRTLGRAGGLRLYAIHRATRILPLYHANLAFVFLVLPTIPTALTLDLSAEALWRHLTFTQALNPSVSRALNPVLWTLTHEALFYALVPVLFLVRAHVPLLIGASIGAHLVALAAPQMLISPFLYHLPLFAFGIALAETQRVPTFLGAAIILAIAPVAVGAYQNAVIAFAIAAFAMAAHKAAFWTWLPLRGFATIGVISYSLYIWHWLLLEMVGPNLGPVLPYANWIADYPFLRGVATIGICLLVAGISYVLIERPAMTRLRERLIRASTR
jgi:peptidoglycan/LPS O-acetylase OafA/YrhL